MNGPVYSSILFLSSLKYETTWVTNKIVAIINAYLASKCGYFLTFRYNPDNQTFNLDSKDVDFDKYDEFLSNENRYANLKKVNKDEAEELLNKQKEWAKNRFDYYSKL